MGAWGEGPFDNDAAADWTYHLTTKGGAGQLLAVMRAFSEGHRVSPGEGELLPEAERMPKHIPGEEEALAAAQVVVWMGEGDSEERTQEVLERASTGRVLPWLLRRGRPGAELVWEARRVTRLALSEERLNRWREPDVRRQALESLLVRLELLHEGGLVPAEPTTVGVAVVLARGPAVEEAKRLMENLGVQNLQRRDSATDTALWGELASPADAARVAAHVEQWGDRLIHDVGPVFVEVMDVSGAASAHLEAQRLDQPAPEDAADAVRVLISPKASGALDAATTDTLCAPEGEAHMVQLLAAPSSLGADDPFSGGPGLCVYHSVDATDLVPEGWDAKLVVRSFADLAAADAYADKVRTRFPDVAVRVQVRPIEGWLGRLDLEMEWG